MDWDHEPVRETPLVWSPGFSWPKTFKPPTGGTPNQATFMESPLSLSRMHWDLEPMEIPLTRLRGRSRFGAAKARPTDTLSHWGRGTG